MLLFQYDDLIGKGPFSSFGNTFSRLLTVSSPLLQRSLRTRRSRDLQFIICHRLNLIYYTFETDNVKPNYRIIHYGIYLHEGILYLSGIQPGVRVPPGVREDILGSTYNLIYSYIYIYILFHDKHIN
jgi:hypothetical protein